MDATAFEQLLTNMTNAENLTRKSAEEQYEQLRVADPLWVMHAVTEMCAVTTSESVLAITIILLRKMFASSVDCYDKATPEVRNAIKGRMLEIFGKNAANKNARSAAACVSALAAKVVAIGDDWSDLWQNLFATITTAGTSSPHRGACCEVIAHTATVLASTYLKGHLQELASGLNNCLQDPSVDVKKSAFAAVQAVTQIVSDAEMAHFRPLVTTMLSTVEGPLNSGDWDAATSLCSALADCVEHNAPLFTQHTTQVLQAMMQVASSPQVAKEARHMAVEVMVTYCDTEPKAVRKVQGFSKALFELLYSYMLHPEIPSDWDTTPDDPEAADIEGVSDLDVGCTSLDRVSTSIRAKQLQEIAQNLFTQHIGSTEWQQRNAALIMLTYVSEGLQDVFSQQLGMILQFVVPMMADEHKMVRNSAVTCISQFCNDFAPQLQSDFHAEVIPALRQALRDAAPRNAATAAAALNSFFDNAEDGDDDDEAVMERLSPYVHETCGDLVNLYNSSSYLFVKGDCLGALSAIIGTCKAALTPYVNDLVPIFQAVLQLPEDTTTDEGKTIRAMKCKATECTTLLACGVGKMHFANYSHAVCNYLNTMLALNLPNDDPRLRYILRGWTCMVECLKEDVLPYLPNVMPPLLNVANLDCDLEIVHKEVGDDEDSDDDDDDNIKKVRLCLPGLGEQTVKIHTSLIEDKELASTIILSIVDELKGKLGIYLQDIAKMAVALLDFSATGDIRENGAQIIALLAESYNEPEQQTQLLPFLNFAIPALLSAAKTETEMSVLGEFLTALSRCLDNTPRSSLSQELVTDIASQVHKVLVDSVERRKKCIQTKAHEKDEDELDALENEDATEQFLLGECNTAIGALLRNCTEQFVPLFISQYLSIVGTLTGEGMDDYDVKTGLCMLSDFVEHAQQSALPHLAHSSAAFLHYTERDDESVQQVSFFGLGLILTLAHASFPQPHAESLQLVAQTATKISHYLSNPIARKEDYIDTTANVLSTSFKAIDLFGQGGAFDAARLMQQSLVFLPADGDEVEAQRVHEQLLRWVVQGHWIFNSVPTAKQMIITALKKAKKGMLNEATMQQLSTM
jgi:importin-5